MWRGVCVALLAMGCRFHFDPLGGPSDGSTDDASDGATAMADANGDANLSPFVQGGMVDTPDGSPLSLNGLSITPGNTVLVVCGGLNLPVACSVSSTPPTTWQQLDPGSTLGVYVACNAPAITSVTVTNGGTSLQLVVTEWSGVVANASCFDTKRISTPCANAPSAWDTGTTPTLSQTSELLIAVAHADNQDAGWTIDAPFAAAFDATGATAGLNVLLGYQQVNAPPTAHKATGTVSRWTNACFTDVFAFKAL